MIGNAPKSPITGVPGWLTNAEEAALIKYAKLAKPGGTIVNIGCEYGRSLIALAKSVVDVTNIYGIDLHPKPELKANIQEANLDDDHHISILEGDSKYFGAAWGRYDDRVNLLFVDGAHEYENVKGDIAAWMPYVVVGGYVLFHDVAQETNKLPHYLHFEVAKAVAEWQEAVPDEFRLVETVDTIAVYQRVNTPTQKEEPKPAAKAAARKPSRKRSTSKS